MAAWELLRQRSHVRIVLGARAFSVPTVLYAKPPAPSDLCSKHLLKKRPMAVRLILITMAKKGHIAARAKPLNQTQSEFLAVVLNVPISSVDAAAFFEFFPVAPAELAPTDFL